MWIELHQSLQRHPKLIRLSAKLRIHKAQSAGHLLFLWLWSLDYAPTGDLSAFGPAEIAAAAECSFDADVFVDALKECGWIELDGKIHDWHEYAGKLLEKREADRERKATKRSAPPPVRGTSSGHPPDGAGTEPNRTVPNQPTEREDARAAGNSAGTAQADYTRALEVLRIYPSKAPKDGRPVNKPLQAQNLLAMKIAKTPDYPWEEHARLEAQNPTPKDAGGWVDDLPNPLALETLRAAKSRMKPTSVFDRPFTQQDKV